MKNIILNTYDFLNNIENFEKVENIKRFFKNELMSVHIRLETYQDDYEECMMLTSYGIYCKKVIKAIDKIKDVEDLHCFFNKYSELEKYMIAV